MDAQLIVDYHALPQSNANTSNANTSNANTSNANTTDANGTVVRALLKISGTAPTNDPRRPLGLSMVLDRSGSMAGERLESARTAAARAVERLHPQDVVSAVLFDSHIDTLAEPAPVIDQQQLPARLRAVEAGSSTNLSGGWLRGREHMNAALHMLGADGSNSRRIVLLTDGHANEGITDVDTLVSLAKSARQRGITTSTIGVGDGYDDTLLRAMADAGGGNAWYIERPDQAQDAFAEELGALLSVAAQDVRVTLTLHPHVSMFTVHSNWPVTGSNGAFTFDLGDLYAAEPKPLLFELLVNNAVDGTPPPSLPIAIATLTVRAAVLTANGGVEQQTVSLPVAATLNGQSLMQPQLEREVLLARTAAAREAAARAQRDGNGDDAARIMREAGRHIAESVLGVNPMYATEFAAELREQLADIETLESQYADGRYSESDAKYQMQRSYNQRRGKQQYDAVLKRKPEQKPR